MLRLDYLEVRSIYRSRCGLVAYVIMVVVLGGHVHAAARVHAQVLRLSNVLIGWMSRECGLPVIRARLSCVVTFPRSTGMLLCLAASLETLCLLVTWFTTAVNLVPLR